MEEFLARRCPGCGATEVQMRGMNDSSNDGVRSETVSSAAGTHAFPHFQGVSIRLLQTESPQMPTRTSERIFLSRGEAPEMLRYRSTATKM